ncbi:MAG: hypothetical protein VX610_03720 [SAR324 cluster bacterium]|nr:hypothetical protein [SAR324 cluster bacterium]
MRQLTRGLLVGLLLGVAVLGSGRESQAQQLKTVLVDSLWGSAIGALAGTAMWALQEKDGDEKLFSGYILRGAALGVFAGIAYGFWDAQQGDAFSQHTPKGLLHWNHGTQQLALRPARLTPEWSVDANSGASRYQLRLFTAEF